MSAVYGVLAALAVLGALEAVRPSHPLESDEVVATIAELVCAVAVGVAVVLALQVGT